MLDVGWAETDSVRRALDLHNLDLLFSIIKYNGRTFYFVLLFFNIEFIFVPSFKNWTEKLLKSKLIIIYKSALLFRKTTKKNNNILVSILSGTNFASRNAHILCTTTWAYFVKRIGYWNYRYSQSTYIDPPAPVLSSVTWKIISGQSRT